MNTSTATGSSNSSARGALDASERELSGATEFNPTAAYLWLLSQQQQHQSSSAALNLSKASNQVNSGSASTNENHGNTSSGGGLNNLSGNGNGLDERMGGDNLAKDLAGGGDESTDDEDEDDMESEKSSNASDHNPVSSSGFNGDLVLLFYLLITHDFFSQASAHLLEILQVVLVEQEPWHWMVCIVEHPQLLPHLHHHQHRVPLLWPPLLQLVLVLVEDIMRVELLH